MADKFVKTIANNSNNAIMKPVDDKEVKDVRYIGKINKQLLNEEFGHLKTDDIVVTEERLKHILTQHPMDYELFEKFGIDTVINPDEIIKDCKNIGTVFMIKKLDETNLNVIVRLVLESDNENYKNSVMTFYRIRNKNLVKLENKNKIIYKKE